MHPSMDHTAYSSTSLDTRVTIEHAPLPSAQEEGTSPPPREGDPGKALNERVLSTSDIVLQSRISTIETRIHKFPNTLREIGGEGSRYVVPSVVSIGPYHHGRPDLQEMEGVKHVAAHSLCGASGRSVEEVYAKVLSITSEARRCYDDKVDELSDADFAAMMFLDGCFRLWFMTDKAAGDDSRAGDGEAHDDDALLRLLRGCNISSGPGLLKDIFMLENQIPWKVLEALMDFWTTNVVSFVFHQVSGPLHVKKDEVPLWKRFLRTSLEGCRLHVPVRGKNKVDDGEEQIANTVTYGNYKPPHLLGLMRFILIHGMPPKERSGEDSKEAEKKRPFIISSSAVDLAQIGVKVTASTAKWFADMKVQKKTVLGELSLSPMFMNDVVASYLVNMAALEAAQASAARSYKNDGYVLSSYLSVLAMLMDSEEDVHQLRKRGVLSSHFSNAQMLTFFKGLGQHLRLGYNYFTTVKDIEDYMQRRPVRTAVHKFFYNHYRIVFTLLSIASVLVGIFKALYSLKKT